MSWTNVVRQALARLRYPTVDSNGNLSGNIVVRRTDTATLLGLTSASVGEIATANDSDMLVVYEDDGSGNPVGVPFSRTGNLVTAYATLDAVSLAAAGSNLPLAATGSKGSIAGLIDAANDVLDFANTGLMRGDSSEVVAITAEISILGISFDVGATLTFKLQISADGSAWTDATGYGASGTLVASGSGAVSGILQLNGISQGTVANAVQYMRVYVTHDSTVDGSIFDAGNNYALLQLKSFKGY